MFLVATFKLEKLLYNIKLPYILFQNNYSRYLLQLIIPNWHNRCFLPVRYHWYAASSLLPASLPHVSLTSSLSSSIRLSSHDFLTHFCYGYITMISITIKSYSTKSFSINIGLLTYHNITIIPSYRLALPLPYNRLFSK